MFKLSVSTISCQVGVGVRRFRDTLCLQLHITIKELDRNISETFYIDLTFSTAGVPRSLHCIPKL